MNHHMKMASPLRLKFELLDRSTRNKTDSTFPVIGPMAWDMCEGHTITLGRHEENKVQPNSIIFRSKVVSRQHAEIWQSKDNKIYIKDLGSSSGTFLNTKRLSPPRECSGSMELKDGDIIQIGSNYHGGLVEKYRFTALRLRIFHLAELNKYAVEDCCICLFSITSGQAMFVTPCRHIFHYKCSRPLLVADIFRCPVCRKENNLTLD